jgi:hypothetical protein
MVGMVKKVNALNAIKIQTYFNEHNELNDPNVLIEYLYVIFFWHLFRVRETFCYFTMVCVDFTLIPPLGGTGLLRFMPFSPHNRRTGMEIEVAKLE